MKLSVYPTRIEIGEDERNNLVAIVEANDDTTVKVEIFLPGLSWNDWMDLSDAVRRAMHMMGMGEEK
jgi:hypothetical protein